MQETAFCESYRTRNKLVPYSEVINGLEVNSKGYENISKEKRSGIIRDYIKIVLYSIFCGNQFELNYYKKKGIAYFAIVRRRKYRITNKRDKLGYAYLKIGLFTDRLYKYRQRFTPTKQLYKILNKITQKYDDGHIYQKTDPAGWHYI